MSYSIYNEKGQITRVVQVNNIEDQLISGESYIEGSFDDTRYYIKNGQPLEMPEKPDNPFCVFDYDTEQWLDNRTLDEIYALSIRHARSERAARLAATDWTQLPDIAEATRVKYQSYRQALRDITLQQGYPDTIVWPELTP